MILPVADKWGGKRGLVAAIGHQILGLGGRYRRFRPVDGERIGRVVFVCKGNICRSPFAEHYARSIGLESDSFGLDASDGAGAAPDAQTAAAALDVDLSRHAASHISNYRPQPDDLLIGFEPWHAQTLDELLAGEAGARISLAGLWLRPRFPHIQDPYATSPAYFATCFRRIVAAVANLGHAVERSGTNTK